MDRTSGKNLPLWLNNIEVPVFLPLTDSISTDVCIIGAGISGLTTAYNLLQSGRSVIVIDDGEIISGESGRTTAHLANILDDRYTEIERVHGTEAAQQAAKSHAAAIDFIENLVQAENIDCHFSRLDGYLFAHEASAIAMLEQELGAVQRAGIEEVEKLEQPALNGAKLAESLRFGRQAQFHPVKYLIRLAAIVQEKGGKIFTNTAATDIETGMPMHVKTSTGITITASQVVMATNTPIHDPALLFSKQAPYRTYVITAPVPSGSTSKALYWDTAEPYHYVRLDHQEGEDVLIIGGEDHRVGEMPSQDPFQRLESWARERFPYMGAVNYRWSGQIMEPVDYLAFIGHMPVKHNNLYVISGDSGNGMTHGTLGAILITDLIMEHHNPWTEIYNPSRKPLHALKDLASHNLTAAAHYLDYVKPGEVSDADSIAPGEGAVIQRGLHKLAVYRDENGQLHECSARCTHLQGIVAWNSIEKSWDCPVHGSRFSPCGKVLNGPADKSLIPTDKLKPKA